MIPLSIYVRSSSHHKVLGCFTLQNNSEQIEDYMKRCLPNQKSLLETIRAIKDFDLKMLEELIKNSMTTVINIPLYKKIYIHFKYLFKFCNSMQYLSIKKMD